MKTRFILIYVIFFQSQLFAQSIPSLRVTNVEERTNELIDKNDPKNIDVNGRVAAGIIIQSNLKDLSFDAFNGIIRSEQKGNEYKILVSEDERLLKVYSEEFVTLEIILREEGIDLNSGSFWLIEITGLINRIEDNKTGSFIVKSNPPGATLKIDGFPDLVVETPFRFENYLARKYSVTASLADYESTTFIMDVNNEISNEFTVELEPKFGYINLNIYGIDGIKLSENDYTLKYNNTLKSDHRKGAYRAFPIGKNLFEVSSLGYKTLIDEQIISNKDFRTIDIQLEPQFAHIKFKALSSSGNELTNVDFQVPSVYEYKKLSKGNNSFALKSGSVKNIVISKNGYRSKTINIDIDSGINKTEEVILLTNSEIDLLPSDVVVRSDTGVVIKVFADSAYSIVRKKNIRPGNYQVDLIHPLKSIQESIFIQPNSELEFYFPILPSKYTAVPLGLIPGGGHFYTKREKRGALYFALTMAAYLISYSNYGEFKKVENNLINETIEYQAIKNPNSLIEKRNQIDLLMIERDHKYQKYQNSLLVGLSLHFTSITDIVITKPIFGYR